MKAKQRKIDGKVVKISKAGYLYIEGKKMQECDITPLHIPVVYGDAVADFCREWAHENYRMTNN